MVECGITKDELCSSRKNPYPPHGRSLEIPRRSGVVKAKFLEEIYENKPEFPGERGCTKQKTLCGGEYGYFLELQICEITSIYTWRMCDETCGKSGVKMFIKNELKLQFVAEILDT